MAEERIPLVGSLTNRLESGAVETSKDQLFINCFPDVTRNAITGTGKVELLKRYGYTSSQTLADFNYSTTGKGATIWTATAGTNYATYAVSRTSGITRVYDETGTQVGGDITPNAYNCTSLTETVISGVPNLVAYIWNNTRTDAWYYPDGGAWTRISDGDFPPNQATPLYLVGEPVHKDGFMFVMDSFGRIWNSDLNSLANWSAIGYINAGDSVDGGAGLALYNNMIVAFGVRTIQFFQNSGNATGSPLTKIPKSINIGISPLISNVGYRYILPVGDTVYFIGKNNSDSVRHVYRLNGLNAEIVSNSAIDKFLNSSTFVEGVSAHLAGVIFQSGKSHILMNGDSTNGAYAFCVETGVWWRAKIFGGLDIPAALGNTLIRGRVIYELGTDFQDAASDMTMTIQLGNMDHGTSKRKFFPSAELVCDKQSTSGNISISWSDDDYATFSTARTIDPSTGSRRITRLGSTKRENNHKRAWKIEETVNRPFRGELLVLNYEVGNA